MPLPYPSFATLRQIDPDNPRQVLARAGEALRGGDPATAWLLADRLVRSRGGADALPYLLRASALARLGHPQDSRRDLDRAAFCDPYDPAVNDALLAVGSPADRAKALHRLIEMDEGRWSEDLVSRLPAQGIGVVVGCSATAEGIELSGRAASPRTIRLTHRGESDEQTLSLEIDQPSTRGFVGRAFVPWQQDDLARAFSTDAAGVIIHPGIVLRPDEVAPATVHDSRDHARAGRGLLVVVPVYDDFAATAACFRALAEHRPADRAMRVVAVDDVTPDARIAGLLDDLAARGAIELIRNRINLGFAASVNRALKGRQPGEDAVLLNADALLPPDALTRLHDIVVADTAIGTLTPLSNNGEDTSVPLRFAVNPLGTDEEIAGLNETAWRANGCRTVAMPNGVGFCMVIAAPLLARQPLLPVAFGRGYYEDVAYGLAARELGFANLCATGVYVGHHGSRSFQSDKRWLVKRNLKRLAERFPGYRAEADAFFAEDPLKRDAARLERAWLADRSVLLALAPAGSAARVTDEQLRSTAGSDAPLVIASLGGEGGMTLRGGAGGFPQSLGVDEAQANGADLLQGLAGGCDAMVAVDPHRLPTPALALARRLSGIVLTTGPAGDPDASLKTLAKLVTGAAAIHATSSRLADIWARHGLVVERPSSPLPVVNALQRNDVLYLIADEGDDDSQNLCAGIGRLWQNGAQGRSLVVIGPTAPHGAPPPIIWAGAIAPDELASWFALAGAGPILLASRLFGCGDARLDAWRAADHPVAHFEPGLTRAEVHGRGLAMPDDWPLDAVADALAGWLERLGRSRAA